jgi:hypothetical protein
MLRRVALVRTDVSEERISSIIRVTRILYYTVFLRSVLLLLVTANVHSSLILVTLMIEVIRSYETSVLTRVTRRNIPEACILESLRSYQSLSSSRISKDIVKHEISLPRSQGSTTVPSPLHPDLFL